MAQGSQELVQADFSGGANVVTSPFVLTKKQCARVRNMILDEHGALTTRDGYSVVTTGTDTTNPVILRGVLNRVDGTSYPYAAQSTGTVGTIYNTTSEPWTSVGTFGSYQTPQSVTINNQELFALGYEVPRVWNGTTYSVITATAGQTVPPGAKHCAFHLGYCWLWNTNAATTTLDGPSAIRMSDANNVNSWPNASQSFISKDDGQVGMGLASYTIAETGISPQSTLIAFKNYSGYQITGVFGASNFAINKIKSDMGCIAPRTIQFVSGFGVMRLSHKGFALYNGVDDRLISEEVRPYIFGHLQTPDISGLNFSAIDRSWSAQSQNPPLYLAACPVTGASLQRLFVYDLVRRAWTICDFPIEFQTLTLFTTPTTQPVVHAGTATGGKIVKLFDGDTTDDGAEVAWSFRSRTFAAGSFLRPTYWRRAIIDALYTPDQSITCRTTLGGEASALSSSQTYTGSAPSSQWGSAVWGQFVWGPSTTVDGQRSFDIMRSAPWAYVDVNGTGQVTIRGLGFHVTPQQITRMHTGVPV